MVQNEEKWFRSNRAMFPNRQDPLLCQASGVSQYEYLGRNARIAVLAAYRFPVWAYIDKVARKQRRNPILDCLKIGDTLVERKNADVDNL